MNVFSFTGNLGKDAELRHTANGDPVVGFSVAVKSGFGKGEKTIWIKCSKFGKGADSLSQYLTKGQQVAVSGEFEMQEWTDKEGNERKEPAVRANTVTLVGGKNTNQAAANQKPESSKYSDDDADQIPF